MQSIHGLKDVLTSSLFAGRSLFLSLNLYIFFYNFIYFLPIDKRPGMSLRRILDKKKLGVSNYKRYFAGFILFKRPRGEWFFFSCEHRRHKRFVSSVKKFLGKPLTHSTMCPFLNISFLLEISKCLN